MTSTAKRCEPGGFTLLEIVIVLLISSLVLAGAVGLMRFSSDGHALRKASRELEAMAKRARMTAVLKQTPYALVFRPGGVDMMPWAEALQDQGLLAADEEAAEERSARGASYWTLTLDNGMRADVRRWNSSEWLPARKNAVHAWRFDPNGLCEPLGVSLVLDDSRMTLLFHPLTAAIDESELLEQ